MTISDKIFIKLKELNMTQKRFSELTGIPESTISDWRKKSTNPSSDKILPICLALDVKPAWLLSAVEPDGIRNNPLDWYVVYYGSDEFKLRESFKNSGGNSRLLVSEMKAYKILIIAY